MDLSYSSEHLRFQEEVRAFLHVEWELERGPERRPDDEFLAHFRQRATERGYLYRSVPRCYGGGGQATDFVKTEILRQAFAAVKAPMEVPGNGVALFIPTLLEWGTEEQKHAFIPDTLRGKYLWAQGYSEPGSGSDLASLRSSAVLRGKEWVITGHKIWTTLAYTSTHMFALLRTEPDAPKHANLSYILLNFKQPGITVRPIRQINGGQEFCEVFLDEVRTPASWLVGERGKGWEVSRTTLRFERNHVGAATRTIGLVQQLVKLAQRTHIDGKLAIQHEHIRERLAEIEGYVEAQIWAGYHQMALVSKGCSTGVLGLTNKLCTTNTYHRVALLAADIIQASSLRAPQLEGDRGGNERWMNQFLGSLGLSIAGGTSNIQRNIIAERGLGLPRSESGD
jgi:alkylation response protein AidB-like acyl-CoA dehydrogenase